MRVIIAGGGTGGLATAIALRRLGIDPLVLEQAPAFTAIGAGLGLQVNAMKAITYLGADRYWRETSTIIDGGEQNGLEDGRPISSSTNDRLVERYGEHYYCGHRADLMTSLLEVLPPEAVRVGSRVVAIEETPNDVAVQLETGEEIRGDLLVGADGLRSRVRSILFEEPEARFTGVVVWRGLMPAAKVPERYYGKIWSWLGPRRHVLVYSLRNNRQPEPVSSFSGFVPASEVQRESWTASGDIKDLRESLEGACSDVQELLDCMDDALITGIYFRDPLESWGTNRVVLLGDAAHPAPPSAGQGAGMALEDAVMLAACLGRHGEDVSAAIKEYEYRRMPRTVRMLESSRVNLANSEQSDPEQVRARNGYYRGLRKLSPLGPPMAEWLLGHDPVAAANRSAEEFEQALAIPPNPMSRPEAKRAFDAWRSALTLEHRANGWVGERAGYEEFAEREFAPPEDVITEAIVCDGVPALRVDPLGSSRSGPLVLHLHGGGYVMGSARSSVRLAAQLAAAVDGRAISVDYRLSPEHPFPAALDDVVRAYRWAVAEHPDVPVIVSGECAGGGLALALALALRDAGEPLPTALHLVSPFCDLTMSSDSLSSDTAKDPWFNPIFATQLAASYVQDSEPTTPALSPLLADMKGLPPLLVQVARDEALFRQAERLVAAANAAGVQTVLSAVDDTVHSFVLFDYLPEAGAAVREFGGFVRDRLPASQR